MQQTALYYANMEGKKCSMCFSFIQIHIPINPLWFVHSNVAITYMMQSSITAEH